MKITKIKEIVILFEINQPSKTAISFLERKCPPDTLKLQTIYYPLITNNPKETVTLQKERPPRTVSTDEIVP